MVHVEPTVVRITASDAATVEKQQASPVPKMRNKISGISKRAQSYYLETKDEMFRASGRGNIERHL